MTQLKYVAELVLLSTGISDPFHSDSVGTGDDEKVKVEKMSIVMYGERMYRREVARAL